MTDRFSTQIQKITPASTNPKQKHTTTAMA